MTTPHKPLLQLLIILFCVIFLATWTSLSDVSFLKKCDTIACIFLETIYRFQGLIGSGLAIIAALIAARPVWLQLRSLRLQQDANARRHIASRLQNIQKRSDYLIRELNKFLADLNSGIYELCWHDLPEEKTICPHHAHNLEHEARRIEENLQNHQNFLNDTQAIEVARANVLDALVQAIEVLNNCSVHARNIGDEEIPNADMDKLKELEANASREIYDRVNPLSIALKQFERASQRDIKSIRRRLRQIDDELLNSDNSGQN